MIIKYERLQLIQRGPVHATDLYCTLHSGNLRPGSSTLGRTMRKKQDHGHRSGEADLEQSPAAAAVKLAINAVPGVRECGIIAARSTFSRNSDAWDVTIGPERAVASLAG